jgi:predicted MFS family arabinose efflux permease
MASALGLAGGSMAGGVIENSVGIVEVFRYTAVLGFVGVVVFNIFMWRNARLAKPKFYSLVFPPASRWD